MWWRVLPVGVAEWQRKFHTKEYALKFASFAASSHFCLSPPRHVGLPFAQASCSTSCQHWAGGANIVFHHPPVQCTENAWSYNSTSLFVFMARRVIRSSTTFLLSLYAQFSNAVYRKQTSATKLFEI